MNEEKKIAEKAAELIVDSDDQELVSWLSKSPKHVGEYMRMSALWDVLADPRLELDAAPSPKRRVWLPLAASLVLAIAIAWWVAARPEMHRTAVGEVTSFLLEDRSVVFLNAESKLSVHYSDTQRRIVLHAGEAVFEVEPDPERPFIVVCGDTRVTAVGTKFAVERRSRQTTVAMIEGKVLASGVPLTSGQRLTVEESGASTVAAVDPRHVAPWRHRRLIFDGEPLAEVAAAFNRFNKAEIHVEGELRDLRISGVFAANDPESLLEYLRTIDGVEVLQTKDAVTVTKR